MILHRAYVSRRGRLTSCPRGTVQASIRAKTATSKWKHRNRPYNKAWSVNWIQKGLRSQAYQTSWSNPYLIKSSSALIVRRFPLRGWLIAYSRTCPCQHRWTPKGWLHSMWSSRPLRAATLDWRWPTRRHASCEDIPKDSKVVDCWWGPAESMAESATQRR